MVPSAPWARARPEGRSDRPAQLDQWVLSVLSARLGLSGRLDWALSAPSAPSGPWAPRRRRWGTVLWDQSDPGDRWVRGARLDPPVPLDLSDLSGPWVQSGRCRSARSGRSLPWVQSARRRRCLSALSAPAVRSNPSALV